MNRICCNTLSTEPHAKGCRFAIAPFRQPPTPPPPTPLMTPLSHDEALQVGHAMFKRWTEMAPPAPLEPYDCAWSDLARAAFERLHALRSGNPEAPTPRTCCTSMSNEPHAPGCPMGGKVYPSPSPERSDTSRARKSGPYIADGPCVLDGRNMVVAIPVGAFATSEAATGMAQRIAAALNSFERGRAGTAGKGAAAPLVDSFSIIEGMRAAIRDGSAGWDASTLNDVEARLRAIVDQAGDDGASLEGLEKLVMKGGDPADLSLTVNEAGTLTINFSPTRGWCLEIGKELREAGWRHVSVEGRAWLESEPVRGEPWREGRTIYSESDMCAAFDAGMAASAGEPIPMILHCPRCGVQHVDRPEPPLMQHGGLDPAEPGEEGWTNPPHKSHLCHECGCIWRPASVATMGVERLEKPGEGDTWRPGDPDCATAISDWRAAAEIATERPRKPATRDSEAPSDTILSEQVRGSTGHSGTTELPESGRPV